MKVKVTKGKGEDCASCLVPFPLLCYLDPDRFRSRTRRCGARSEGTLPPHEHPFYLTGVYSGCPPAPQRPEAGCARLEACWSEPRPEDDLTDQTALKSGEQWKKKKKLSCSKTLFEVGGKMWTWKNERPQGCYCNQRKKKSQKIKHLSVKLWCRE